MGIDTLIAVLIWAVVVFVIAWVAYYIITTFFPEPIRTPALLVIGVLLLLIVLYAIMGSGSLPGRLPVR